MTGVDARQSEFGAGGLSLLFRAVAYATELHRGQTRKGSRNQPYIEHPVEVAEVLWEIGGVRDLTVITAAILHDTVEDTEATLSDLDRRFGPQVRDLVAELSDDKRLEKTERKRLQVETAARKSPRARLIKLADKIANVRDVGLEPPRDWSLSRRTEYLNWSESVVAGLRGTSRALEERFDAVLAETRGILRGEEESG